MTLGSNKNNFLWEKLQDPHLKIRNQENVSSQQSQVQVQVLV